MPDKKTCAKEWKKLGYSSVADCIDYKPKTKKAGTSSKAESGPKGY